MSYEHVCVTHSVTIGLEEISPKIHSNLFIKCAPEPEMDMYMCAVLLLALIPAHPIQRQTQSILNSNIPD
jgi:hypothetical protein